MDADLLATKATVHVVAVKGEEPGTVIFALGGKVTPSGKGKVCSYYVEVVSQDPPPTLTFRLFNREGLNLKFRTDPISIQRGIECPREGAGTDVYKVVSKSDREVEVRGTPNDREAYSYTLFFEDKNDPNNKYVCDPIIKNIA